MKKLTYLLGIAFLLCTFSLKAQPAQAYGNKLAGQLNWQPNYNAAVSSARSSAKPILILFTGTNWCPACIKLERDVLTKPEFAQIVGDKFIFLKAEFPSNSADAIQASPFKFLLDRYRVEGFPTMIVINPDGQVLFTVNYQAKGPNEYANEMINKLSQVRNTAPANQYY